MLEILENMENLSEIYDISETAKKKIRRGEWAFLDKMDKNLLYIYANVLSGKAKQMRLVEYHGTNAKKTEDNGELDEERRKNAYYLIWFVYRYILKCETYEQTIPYQTKETLRKYRLLSYVQNEILYIGMSDDKIKFRKVEDISMILEILYNRYSFMEQIDCFIRNTKKTRCSMCKQMKKRVEEKFAKILDTINEGGNYDIFY